MNKIVGVLLLALAACSQQQTAQQQGAGVNAPPVTYQVNGAQYIAVAAGGNFQLGYAYGDVVAIFKLR